MDNNTMFGSTEREESFVVDFAKKSSHKEKFEEHITDSGTDLQRAFLAFKKRRQRDVAQQKLMKERELSSKCDQTRMLDLRLRFLAQAKQYFGVPYKKKYHEPGTVDYNSPLFLDCCGLVRRILLDLKENFGFTIGRWNQAYQFDTLPIVIENQDAMRPGDLVFISGIYNDPKRKQQKHNMVHVEIWAGDGVKTIGARWQRGRVQVHDSYRFESKSYHSMVYHFRSIDSWLRGICKSYCKKHSWKKSNFKPTKRSVFARGGQSSEEDAESGLQDMKDGARPSLRETLRGYVTTKQTVSSYGTALVQRSDDSIRSADASKEGADTGLHSSISSDGTALVQRTGDSLISADASKEGADAGLHSSISAAYLDVADNSNEKQDYTRDEVHRKFFSLSGKVTHVDILTSSKTGGGKFTENTGSEWEGTKFNSKEDVKGVEDFMIEIEVNLNEPKIHEEKHGIEMVKSSKDVSADAVKKVEDHVDPVGGRFHNSSGDVNCDTNVDQCRKLFDGPWGPVKCGDGECIDDDHALDIECMIAEGGDDLRTETRCDIDVVGIPRDETEKDSERKANSWYSSDGTGNIRQMTCQGDEKLAHFMNAGDGEGKGMGLREWVTRKDIWCETAGDLASTEERDLRSSRFEQTGEGEAVHLGESIPRVRDELGSSLNDRELTVCDLANSGTVHFCKDDPKHRDVTDQIRKPHAETKIFDFPVNTPRHSVEPHRVETSVWESLTVSDVEDLTSLDEDQVEMDVSDKTSEIAAECDDGDDPGLILTSNIDLLEAPKEIRNQPMDADDPRASPSQPSTDSSLTNQQLPTAGSDGASSSDGNKKFNMEGKDDNGEQDGKKMKPKTDRRKPLFKVDNTPLFYIGGHNGVSLVEEPLVAKGWQRIEDAKSDRYKLRWVEIKSQINYSSFRPGEQLINRIPGSGMLATKTGLFNTLRDYERLYGRLKKGNSGKTLKMLDFFPESYVLDVKADREAFFQTFKEGEIWICKPNNMNQGKGIYLVRDLAELKEKYKNEGASGALQRSRVKRGTNQRIIQRYLPDPLLLNGKKFDVRTYMLIACTSPFVVFYHSGYCRLSCEDYDPLSTDLARHLTNQYQQKKVPRYQDMKNETVWSMERFNEYINMEVAEKHGLPSDWVFGHFTKKMHQVMTHCFHAVKYKLDTKLGLFDLLGFDFIIDADMKVWLLEVNVNPALHTNCDVLREKLPPMIRETLDITLEIFEKSRKREKILPVRSAKNFHLLHSATAVGGGRRINAKGQRSKSISPIRNLGNPCNPVRNRGVKSTLPPTNVSVAKERGKVKVHTPEATLTVEGKATGVNIKEST